eukprot:COSAG06_NODE_19693_length_826_cov_1.543329_2_plen_44_part_01
MAGNIPARVDEWFPIAVARRLLLARHERVLIAADRDRATIARLA